MGTLSVSSKHWGWDLGQSPASSAAQVFLSFSAKEASILPTFAAHNPKLRNGEANFTAAKANRKTKYLWQDQNQQVLCHSPVWGSRPICQHQPLLHWVPGALRTPQDEAPLITPWHLALESFTDDSIPQQQQYIQWAMVFPHTGKKTGTLVKNTTSADREEISSWHEALHITEAQVTAKSGPENLLLGYVLAKYNSKPDSTNIPSSAKELHWFNSSEGLWLNLMSKSQTHPCYYNDCRYQVRAASAAHIMQGGPADYTERAEQEKPGGTSPIWPHGDLPTLCPEAGFDFKPLSPPLLVWVFPWETTSFRSEAEGGLSLHPTHTLFLLFGPTRVNETIPVLKAKQVPKLTGPKSDFLLWGTK